MAPDRAARIATFALMAVAYAACEVAAYPDGQPRPFGVACGVVVLAVAIAVSYLAPPPSARLSRSWQAALVGVFLLPLLAEPVVRNWTGDGLPLELQLVNGLRLVGLLLCGLGVWPRCRHLAGMVALFLALFTSAMGDQPAIPYLLTAFAIVGGLWLVLNYRADTGMTETAVAGTEIERAALRMPYREAAVFGVLAVVAAGVAFAGPKRVVLTLGELVPTSGGTGETDPFARYGVGDGPEEMAGPNAKAAGMVETDRMIEDTKDALIDAVNDMYGPPHRPPKERERMVAAGLAEMIQNHGKLPDNRRPSRDFDTGRKGPQRDGLKPDSQKARGVFEIEGRTPLHVRLVVYDVYDPETGRWREARKPPGRLLEPDGGDWMRLGFLRETADWYAADDRHRLKVADLRDNLVPTPTLLTRIRINKVDRPDYYEWDYDGVLALAGRKRTPPGVVVTTDCRTVDPAALSLAAFSTIFAPGYEVPAELAPAIAPLAAEWAADRSRGWPQLAAVVEKLRSDYVLDRDAAAPEGHPAPILWFLNESRRGPDYLFASAAALMFRSLGYPTRVCLGYYAAPDSYDPDTGHTPVKRSDLHVWPEVQLTDGHWLVVEPTPGYAVLPPLKSWQERLRDALAAIMNWAARNRLPLLSGACAVILAVWRRRLLIDWVYTTWWTLFPGRTWRQVVLGAVRVLERRGRLAGVPRPASHSLTTWSRTLSTGRTEDGGLATLICLAEWAAYAPSLAPPVPDHDIMTACRNTLGRWPLSAFISPGAMKA
jgi:transglutaminase-like putative cysteine protease